MLDECLDFERYTFDDACLGRLATFVREFPDPCTLCAPRLGLELERRGVPVAVLDIDERFTDLHGFRRFDLHRPAPVGRRFGLIVCDPPFFGVTPERLLQALWVLSDFDSRQPMLVSCLRRHACAFAAALAPFGLEPTGYRPGYRSDRAGGCDEIEFFGNLGRPAHTRLAGLRCSSWR